MPYRSAYLWTVLVGLLTIPAFWRGYFSRLDDTALALHIHAITAIVWVVLLAFQAWSAHRKARLGLHRAAGRASLYYFPIFLAGCALVIWSMANHTAFGESPIYEAHGEGLGAYDIVGTLAIGWFYYEALKGRRQVHVHARFMIGTLFVLLGPVLARLLIIPFFMTFGESWSIADHFFGSLIVTQALIICLAVALYRLAPIKGRRPCAVIAFIMVVQTSAFLLGRLSDHWREIFVAMGGTSPVIWALAGFTLGAIISWAGWQSGKTPAKHSSAAPAATQSA